ncbi:MAG: hypothetical protein ACXQTG_04525 [Methanoculleaceae archaeon]
MADRGSVPSDRDLTEKGRAETESALVETGIGYIISRLERLAFRTTFDLRTGTDNVAAGCGGHRDLRFRTLPRSHRY